MVKLSWSVAVARLSNGNCYQNLNLSVQNLMWNKSKMQGNTKLGRKESQVEGIPSAKNPMQKEFQVKGIPGWRNLMWRKSQVEGIPSGGNPKWREYQVEGISSGGNTKWRNCQMMQSKVGKKSPMEQILTRWKCLRNYSILKYDKTCPILGKFYHPESNKIGTIFLAKFWGLLLPEIRIWSRSSKSIKARRLLGVAWIVHFLSFNDGLG